VYFSNTGYRLPTSRQAVIFADDARISVYAKEAVMAIRQAGVINFSASIQHYVIL